MSAQKKKTKTRKTNLPGPVRALWEAREAGSRGPKPALSADEIAQVAIRVADAEGLGAVSMQRIAREVNVTAMALYRYVASKDELVDRMMEQAGGPAPRWNGTHLEWRSRLTRWAHDCAAIYRRHPWFAHAATARRRVMGPNELEWLDAALAGFHDAGLRGRDQMEAFLLLIGHVRSHAEFSAGDAEGVLPEEWVRITTELAVRHRERYTGLLGAIDAGAFAPLRRDSFAFGLACILEGIEAMAGGANGSRSKPRKRIRRT